MKSLSDDFDALADDEIEDTETVDGLRRVILNWIDRDDPLVS